MFISITYKHRHWYEQSLGVGWMRGGGDQWDYKGDICNSVKNKDKETLKIKIKKYENS